jgi:hypothetical protein
MTSRTSSIVGAAPPFAERRDVLRRESRRDFVGIAVGVALGALTWLAFLSHTRAAL